MAGMSSYSILYILYQECIPPYVTTVYLSFSLTGLHHRLCEPEDSFTSLTATAPAPEQRLLNYLTYQSIVTMKKSIFL